MSVADILDQVAKGQLTPAEAAKLMPSAPSANGMIVKFNQSGGVYVKHPKFKAISKEQKPYIAGINLDAAVARVLFGDDAVLTEIRSAVNSLLS